MARPKRPPKERYALGQWVEFILIVSPKRDSEGRPVLQSMGRVRKGMVIGIRTVYRRLPGENPPKLVDGKKVYVVAVSHHRCYRVFEENIKV